MTAWTAAPDPDLSRDPFDVWACPRDDAHGPHRWRPRDAHGWWHCTGLRKLDVLAFIREQDAAWFASLPAQAAGHDSWCRSRDPLWADYPVCDCRLAVIAAAHDDGHTAQPPSAGPWTGRGATNTPTDDSQATEETE